MAEQWGAIMLSKISEKLRVTTTRLYLGNGEGGSLNVAHRTPPPTNKTKESLKVALQTHVKMSVGKWILEITPLRKHVQIPEE